MNIPGVSLLVVIDRIQLTKTQEAGRIGRGCLDQVLILWQFLRYCYTFKRLVVIVFLEVGLASDLSISLHYGIVCWGLECQRVVCRSSRSFAVVPQVGSGLAASFGHPSSPPLDYYNASHIFISFRICLWRYPTERLVWTSWRWGTKAVNQNMLVTSSSIDVGLLGDWLIPILLCTA